MAGNFALDTLASGDSLLVQKFNDNFTKIENALGDPFTADMTSGNVTLTDTQFRDAAFILGDNVTVAGRDLTIPNSTGKIFVVKSDSGNTQDFDLIKGATSFAIAPGDVRVFFAGSGANDLDEAAGIAGGVSTVAVKPPLRYARVTKNATQALTAGVSTAITFQTEVADTDAFHDTGSNTERMTIPTGVTKVKLRASIDRGSTAGTQGTRIWIAKNGGAIPGEGAQGYTQNDNLTSYLQVHTGVVDCVATDYFEVYVNSQDAATVANNNSTWFEIEVVEDDNTASASYFVHQPLNTPTANLIVGNHIFTTSVDFSDDFAGSNGYAITGPSGGTLHYDVDRNGTKIGEVRFADGANVATFNTTAATVESFVAGDRMRFTAPATINGSPANVAWTIKGIMK